MTPPSADIRAGDLPLSASAPGKCILFGEHAVVQGLPELVFALDLRTQVVLRSSDASRLNGSTEDAQANRYLGEALRRLDAHGVPLDVTAISRLPKGSGLGSSAAFVAALAAGLSSLGGGIDRAGLAQRAFSVERGAQGVGSPGDTSASVAGGFVALNADRGVPLWEVSEGDESWRARRIEDPGWNWIVAYSRVPHDTGAAVRRVLERFRAEDGGALKERFRAVALSGIDAVRSEDREATGRAMAENQELLRTVGVATPRLEELLRVAAAGTIGAKITGAGMGGSIVALPVPGREIEVTRRLAARGADAFVVRPSPDGAGLV